MRMIKHMEEFPYEEQRRGALALQLGKEMMEKGYGRGL